jgi:hypothetical protein
MQHTSRVSPCYPYRYKKEGESDEAYAQRLADELEQEILRVGEGKVAAFFAETGMFHSERGAYLVLIWECSRRRCCWKPHTRTWIFPGDPKSM